MHSMLGEAAVCHCSSLAPRVSYLLHPGVLPDFVQRNALFLLLLKDAVQQVNTGRSQLMQLAGNAGAAAPRATHLL